MKNRKLSPIVLASLTLLLASGQSRAGERQDFDQAVQPSEEALNHAAIGAAGAAAAGVTGTILGKSITNKSEVIPQPLLEAMRTSEEASFKEIDLWQKKNRLTDSYLNSRLTREEYQKAMAKVQELEKSSFLTDRQRAAQDRSNLMNYAARKGLKPSEADYQKELQAIEAELSLAQTASKQATENFHRVRKNLQSLRTAKFAGSVGFLGGALFSSAYAASELNRYLHATENSSEVPEMRSAVVGTRDCPAKAPSKAAAEGGDHRVTEAATGQPKSAEVR